MDSVYITFRSVTYAQRGEQVLRSAGIGCTLQRTPGWMELQGCGYCLRLQEKWVRRAVELLQHNKVPMRRVYVHGSHEEMKELVL